MDEDDDGRPDLRDETQKPWPEHPSLRYIIYHSLRREDLCKADAPMCEGGDVEEDEQGRVIAVVHGPDCPRDKLDDAVARNPVLQRAIDIDFANAAGFRLTLDEVDVEEFAVIKVLRSERNKFEAEQMKKPAR